MRRVLLADADDQLLTAYRVALASAGFEAVTATNALECLFYLRRSTPNLLVMDSQLPWGATEGILSLMREDADLPQIPVIVLDDPTTSGGTISQAMSGHIVLKKPVTPARLVTAARELLRPVWP